MTVKQIKVLLAQQDPVALARVRRVVARDSGAALVGEAVEADEAVEIATRELPDVAVVSGQTPDESARIATRIREAWPGTKIAACPIPLDGDYLRAMFDAGTLSFLTAGSSDEEILLGLAAAARGHAFLSVEATTLLLPRLAEFMRATGDLADARRDLDDAKRQFAAIVTHEILTPTAVIQGVAHTLASRRNLPDEQRATLADSAVRAGEQLTRLLANLSTAAAVDTGSINISRRAVPVRVLLDAIRAKLGLQDRLLVEVDTGPDARVDVDPRLVVRALTGVIENCLEHSPAGEPVELRATTEAGRVEIHVSDRGAGIPIGAHQRIFELFVQGDSSDARPRRGSGVGLYLARRVMELHGGSITAANRDGGGSTFVVCFPPRD